MVERLDLDVVHTMGDDASKLKAARERSFVNFFGSSSIAEFSLPLLNVSALECVS